MSWLGGISIPGKFEAEQAAMHGLQQFGLHQGRIPQQRVLSAPAFAQKLTQVVQPLITLIFAPVVEVGRHALAAKSPLAWPLADPTAQADGFEQRRSALPFNRGYNFLHRALRYHFTLAQQLIIRIVGAHPQLGRQSRLGPFGIHGGDQGFFPRTARLADTQTTTNQVRCFLGHQAVSG